MNGVCFNLSNVAFINENTTVIFAVIPMRG